MNETSNPPAEPQPPAPPLQDIRVALPALAPKATYAILGFTIFVYLLQNLSVVIFGYATQNFDWLEVLGGGLNSFIREGQLWRFITPVFLHFSVVHIAFNMYALFSIGSFVERQFGHGKFLLLYFLAAFSGGVFSFLLTSDNALGAGASGAVFGLVGAEAVFFYQNRKLFGTYARQALGNTAFIVVINLIIGMTLGFDNWDHIGGLLGGAMFAWFAGPLWAVAGVPPMLHLEDQRETRETIIGTTMILVLFGLMALWGIRR